MSDRWVVWSEEHRRWWKAGEWGYTDSLLEAGRYSEAHAKEIERNGNYPLRIMGVNDEFNEVAIPDPTPGVRVAKPSS
jgi:hypothetical protein